MQRLVMCGKGERKGGLVGGLVFGGDGQITEIDVLPVTVRRILRADLKNEDLPVIERMVLRADLQKRGFARNREAGFTGRFAKT